MIRKQKITKAILSKQLSISRSSLYYESKQLPKDWQLKTKIEDILRENPSYGYPRIALALQINKKRAARVMRLFGMKAYRRRGRKFRKSGLAKTFYSNLLKTNYPRYPNDIWVADFTYISYQQKFIYLATVMDIFTRKIVGVSVMMNHAVLLTLQAFFAALSHCQRPIIFHSDNGREYSSKVFTRALSELGIQISRSAKSSPWENGYQESFYSQFKVDLGDSNRFKTLGELVYEIHRLVWNYNYQRIHSALKMPPALFANRYQKLVEKVS